MPICDRCKKDVIRAHPVFFGNYWLCVKCHAEWIKNYPKWTRKLTDEEWLREFHRFIGIWSVS